MNLFDPKPYEVDDEYRDGSYAVRLTIRRRRLLASGVNPGSGLRLAGIDQTCGSCGHLIARRPNRRTYYKCDLVEPTAGPATDVRVGWPACVAWAPSRDSAPGVTIDELLGDR